MAKPEYDICVIGGGSAGLVVAAGGATLGAKVALIERDRMGGDCLNTGCVPSKALLHAAKVNHAANSRAAVGIDGDGPVAVELPKVLDYVRSVIATIEPNDSPERFRDMGVDVVFGEGQFAGADRVKVGDREITAKKFVIATGTRPSIPPIPGIDDVPVLTNESVFELTESVAQLLVIGGGPIAVEMAQAFCRLGAAVDLVEMMPQILPREDADMAGVVRHQLEAEGVRIHTQSDVKQVRRNGDGVELQIVQKGGEPMWLSGSHLLVAAGRKTNIESLNLAAAGVVTDHNSVKTDARLRTTNRSIYACGDVAGPYLFTHMAEHQAGVVLRNALFHLPAKVESSVIPWATFTDPELARVGLSEAEAKAGGVAHEVFRFPFSDIDRAIADSATEGMAKIIAAPNGRILGAAIVGPNAGELIHEYALAMSKKMKLKDLSGFIHIYPTLAQINRRVADERMKSSLTPARKRLMQRMFGLRGE